MEILHRWMFVFLGRPHKAKQRLITKLLFLEILILICSINFDELLCSPVGPGQNVTAQIRSNTTVLPSSRPPSTNSTTRKPKVVVQESLPKSQTRGGLRNTARKPKLTPGNLGPRVTESDIAHMFPENIDHYPESEINSILENTPMEVKELFNAYNTPLDPNMNLSERFISHDDEDSKEYESKEESICRSVTRNIYPREARKNSVPVYIPNSRDFMQVIQAEICQNPDQDCSYLQDALPYGMQSVCYQKYSYKKLLYLDSLEKRMASDLFRYPSCCSCYVKTLSLNSVELRSANRNSSMKHINNQAQILNSSQDMSSSSTLSPAFGAGDGDEQQMKASNQTMENGSKELQDENKSGGFSHSGATDLGSGNSTLSQVSSDDTRTPEEASPISHTVISHEDNVFIPNNKTRK